MTQKILHNYGGQLPVYIGRKGVPHTIGLCDVAL
jgi:hypothetical protein